MLVSAIHRHELAIGVGVCMCVYLIYTHIPVDKYTCVCVCVCVCTPSIFENENISLKLNIQKTKIMISSPITSWQIDVGNVETVSDFIVFGSADGDCSREIKSRLLLGRKAMTNMHSVLKCRDITLLTKVLIVKAMVFPIVMYESERP